MPKQPPYDYTQLAAAFLDLWQKQLVATFNDPKVVSATLEAMRAAGGFEAPYENIFAPFGAQPARHSAAGIPKRGDDAVRQLEKRLGTLEKRLARLESGAEKPRRKTAATSKKPKKR